MSVRLPVLLCSVMCVASMAHAQNVAAPTPSQAEATAAPAAATPTVPTPAAATTDPSPAPAASALTAPGPIAAAPAAAAPPAPRVAPVVRSASAVDMTKEYLIGPEDVLDITVWKNCPDLCRTVPVRPDGKLSLPLVNDVQASGLTPMDLRQHLTEQLAEYIPSPEVSVIVREVHNFKVAVVGAVKMPGDYEIKSQATVLELLARAQGLTEFANRDKIVVLRQKGTKTERIKFNYRKVAEGDDEDNLYVRAGDIIVVP
jgi:polysaccharide export outer membrane protein